MGLPAPAPRSFPGAFRGPGSRGVNAGLWHRAGEEPRLLWHLGSSWLAPGSGCMEPRCPGRHQLPLRAVRAGGDRLPEPGGPLRVSLPLNSSPGLCGRRELRAGQCLVGARGAAARRGLHILEWSLQILSPPNVEKTCSVRLRGSSEGARKNDAPESGSPRFPLGSWFAQPAGRPALPTVLPKCTNRTVNSLLVRAGEERRRGSAPCVATAAPGPGDA